MRTVRIPYVTDIFHYVQQCLDALSQEGKEKERRGEERKIMFRLYDFIILD